MKVSIKKKAIVFCIIIGLFVSAIAGFTLTGNSRAELKAAAYSNADLNFTLFNNSQEYRVSALNKQLTEAIIPATYNGLPVTEIADNSFTNCTNLTYVFVPYTVKRVGNNAFANCKNLERIAGMPEVNAIGNNAFAMCTKLNKLILPSKITTLGNTILRNNPNEVYSRLSKEQMSALNASWDSGRTVTEKTFFGNEIVYDEVIDNGKVVAYKINSCQNLDRTEDLKIYSSHNDLPVIDIQPNAFYFNEFNSITLKHREDNEYEGETIKGKSFSHTVNISSGAFYGVKAESINIKVDISLEDSDTVDYPEERENGTSIEVFCNTEVNSITLPNSLSRITRSMFSNSKVRYILSTDPTIEANHLSSSIKEIDTAAFEFCTGINTLYIPKSVETMGSGVFSAWGSTEIKQKIVIDAFSAGKNWDQDWRGTLYDNATIEFNKVFVIFDRDGGEGGSDFVQATYDQVMPEATAPKKEFYVFGGYFSARNGKGKQYYDENMNSVNNWDKTSTSTLYAYWTWDEKAYEVELDNQGGIGTQSIRVYFGEPMPKGVASPTCWGKRFEGYFSEPNGQGTKYYNADMSSAHIWDIPQNSTLYACWTVIESITDLPADCESFTVDAITYGFSVTLKLPEQLDSKCEIVIDSDVEQLRLVGVKDATYSLYIQLLGQKKSFTLILENVSIHAPTRTTAIYMPSVQTLNLYTYGVVKVYGGNGTQFGQFGFPGSSGATGIDTGRLIIHSADDLLIQGGNGAHGMPGMNGQNGGSGGSAGCAVYVSLNYVKIICGNVTLSAGTAGNGGMGGAGTSPGKGGSGGSGSEAIVGTDDVEEDWDKDDPTINVNSSEDGENGSGGLKLPEFPTPDIPRPNPGGPSLPQPPGGGEIS